MKDRRNVSCVQPSALHPAVPFGELGPSEGIPYANVATVRNTWAPRTPDAVAAQLTRPPFLWEETISPEYFVDTWAKIEEARLAFIQFHQRTLRAEMYLVLGDATVAEDVDPRSLGRRVYLPATFTGGKRYMDGQYHDAIAIARELGRPHYFITITCNTKKPEIEDALLPGQGPRTGPM